MNDELILAIVKEDTKFLSSYFKNIKPSDISSDTPSMLKSSVKKLISNYTLYDDTNKELFLNFGVKPKLRNFDQIDDDKIVSLISDKIISFSPTKDLFAVKDFVSFLLKLKKAKLSDYGIQNIIEQHKLVKTPISKKGYEEIYKSFHGVYINKMILECGAFDEKDKIYMDSLELILKNSFYNNLLSLNNYNKNTKHLFEKYNRTPYLSKNCHEKLAGIVDFSNKHDTKVYKSSLSCSTSNRKWVEFTINTIPEFNYDSWQDMTNMFYHITDVEVFITLINKCDQKLLDYNRQYVKLKANKFLASTKVKADAKTMLRMLVI